MRMTFSAALAALALLVAGLARAQTPAPGVPAPGTTGQDTSRQAMDTDRDGSISLIEAGANPALASQFALFDQNGNGALEPAEFARFEATGSRALGTTSGTPGSPGVPGTPGSPVVPGTPASPGVSGSPAAGTPPPIGTTPPPLGTAPPPPPGTAPPPAAPPPPLAAPAPADSPARTQEERQRQGSPSPR